MAKERGKKFKRKGKKVGQPSAKMKKVKAPKVNPSNAAPPTDPAEATASDPASYSNPGPSQGKKKEKEKVERLSGFIFMCNSTTKLECYQYRVFGLPAGKKEVVEKIKPGTKLFLFDFELKLLYGIYEATSDGKLNLEPAAFRGKFPAQVKFKIFKECIPLPESSLRSVIKENYAGLKFKQELSGKQVRKLLSSFRPLTASSSLALPQALANVSLPLAMPPSAMENQFKPTGRLPVMEVRYLSEMQYGRIPPVAEPQLVNTLQHGHHRAAAYMECVNPTLDHLSLPETSHYYVANSQQQSFTEGVAHRVQEPSHSRTIEERACHDQVTSLERYRTIEGRAPRDQVTVLERQYHQLPLHREALDRDNVAAYNSNLAVLGQYTSSVTQPQAPAPYHRPTLQRDRRYQHSEVAYSSNLAAPAQYTATLSQPQALATYHQLPLLREALYHRDDLAAYNSNPAAPAQYTARVSQPQAPATYNQLPLQTAGAYNSYLAAPGRYAYTSSVTQPHAVAPGVSHGSAPITSYYSYTAANRLVR